MLFGYVNSQGATKFWL